MCLLLLEYQSDKYIFFFFITFKSPSPPDSETTLNGDFWLTVIIGLIGLIGLIRLIGLIGIIGQIGLIGLSSPSSLFSLSRLPTSIGNSVRFNWPQVTVESRQFIHTVGP